MEELKKDIKTRQFHKVYLLFGEETYLLRSWKHQLTAALVGEDPMNFTRYEGKNTDWKQVWEMAQTLPFFAERRLLLLENTEIFKGSCEDGWLELLSSIPEGCHLVFVEQEIDKRGRVYKAVKEQGLCVEFVRQQEAMLRRWVVAALAKENRKITQEALERFLQKTGDDMEAIHTELEKLICYGMGREEIFPEDVEQICAERTTNRVFEMVEAAATGRVDRALELYYDLLALKEPGMRILFLLARQMNQLLQIKEMQQSHVGKDQIAQSMKLRPFIVAKLMGQARSFRTEELQGIVSYCVECETAVKTGLLTERIAVEMVLIAITKRLVFENQTLV